MIDERKDKRGAPPGHQGNVKHQRNELAAKQIEVLAGFGLPRHQIALAVETLFADQGYSPDTLERHYRDELDRGMAQAKVALMRGAYDRALMRNLPDGVSKDSAYREAGRAMEFLLKAVHEVVPIEGRRHAGPDGGDIPIAIRGMSDEEVEAKIREHEARRAMRALPPPDDDDDERSVED